MATIRSIKGRIKSAKNISQITKAMQMVSAAKMKKAQDKALEGKPYSEKIRIAVRELVKSIDISLHPLLRQGNPYGKTLIVLISTNKGLCGSLNTLLFRQIPKWFLAKKDIHFVTVGKKGERFVVRQSHSLDADFSDTKDMLDTVSPITDLFVRGYLNGEYKEVYLVYNSFINSLKQEPVMVQVLPLSIVEVEETEEENRKKLWREFIIEPSAKEVLSKLLPHYIEIQVRSAVLNALASEHSARMFAMKNATDNALSLIDDLTLTYNRLRQEQITNEIADIVTARESLS